LKYLQCISPGQFAYGDEGIQPAGQNRALIKIAKVGVCGTDIHAFEGTQPFFSYPRILGHELAGIVVNAPDSSGVLPGDAVTVIPYLHCGDCHMCRSGRTNACVSLQVCGVHVDGGMREYFSVPVSNLLLAEGLSHEQLAVVEPLSVGCHAVRRAKVSQTDVVVVVGAGPIGYAAILFAGLAGARVIAVDVDATRLSYCAALRGVTTLTGSLAEVGEKLKEITDGRMASVVMDATGSQAAINSAFQLMGYGSTYVLVGLQKGNIEFSHPEFHKREGTLMSSRNATREDFQFVMESIRSGSIDPMRMITHRIPFGEAATMFPTLLQRGNGLLKALIEF
jgi:2-desacetyl-2-hydroxyethyl bacteriochlorophyllide A dehydrogenase